MSIRRILLVPSKMMKIVDYGAVSAGQQPVDRRGIRTDPAAHGRAARGPSGPGMPRKPWSPGHQLEDLLAVWFGRFGDDAHRPRGQDRVRRDRPGMPSRTRAATAALSGLPYLPDERHHAGWGALRRSAEVLTFVADLGQLALLAAVGWSVGSWYQRPAARTALARSLRMVTMACRTASMASMSS